MRLGGALLLGLGLLVRRGLAEVDAIALVTTSELALLREMPMFAPLAAPVIERVAAQLLSSDVPTGCRHHPLR